MHTLLLLSGILSQRGIKSPSHPDSKAAEQIKKIPMITHRDFLLYVPIFGIYYSGGNENIIVKIKIKLIVIKGAAKNDDGVTLYR